MTRHYATFDCGMWDDPEGFSALGAGAQRTYFMLVTQRDISACGSLPLTLRRWARTCSEKDVSTWLDELVRERYLLVDDDTEEVLVRTFMKWDGGYKHAKRVQAVIASALAIRSLSIRTAACGELARLGVSIPGREPTDPLRSVVTEVSTNHTPQSALTEPESAIRGGEPEPASEDAPPPHGIEDLEPPEFCSEHMPDGSDANCGRCAGARKRHDRWLKRDEKRAAEAAAAFRQAIKDCDQCDEHGRRLDPDSGAIVGICNHADHRASA